MNKINIYFLLLFLGLSTNGHSEQSLRTTISLNGRWSIAKTSGELPQNYRSTIPVPGLVDMAMPRVDSVGTLYNSKESKGNWYWHRRSFTLKENNFDIIQLKVFKAMYYTKVYLNKHLVGENAYCFTPSYYDLKPYLNAAGQPNEIVIGVGTILMLPDTIHNGKDGEKLYSTPGIYDNVELTLANKPFISNVQVAPDLINEQVRVVAEVQTENSSSFNLKYEVSELASKKVCSQGVAKAKLTKGEDGLSILDFEVAMKGAKLWSPESPFMYKLTLETSGDKKETQFAMRSFRFDTLKKCALLNEKPYYLRGTNICIFRFFEDPSRGDLPWNNSWIIKINQKIKGMYWNAMRYSIGFPPERWYEVADSLGILVQDEYPLWGAQSSVKDRHFAHEFTRWMRERWNHPSVVIWDAQNEGLSKESGKAIELSRKLDLSNRPWDNGWSEPQSPTDPIESHPYLFNYFKRNPTKPLPEEGYLKLFFGVVRNPNNDPNDRSATVSKKGIAFSPLQPPPLTFNNPSIINEYGYLWINRDGSTVPQTDSIYVKLWGKNLSNTDRRTIYAKNIAMLTEYWRAYRKAAGVLQFCGLGYSRPAPPRGETSDAWINIEKLQYEPQFYKYVRSSFAPVGLMIEAWGKSYKSGTSLLLPVHVLNDLGETYKGTIKIILQKEGKVYAKAQGKVKVDAYGKQIVNFNLDLPKSKGVYELKAQIQLKGEPVTSYRDLTIE